MEKERPKNSMTTTFYLPGFYFNGNDWRMAGLLFLLPALLAIGMMEKSRTQMSLPDKDAYRSPLSENLLESNRWRAPQEKERDWRLPAPPPVGWRTPQPSQSDTSPSKQTIELFPRYQPGKAFDFDYIEREEKPLIKMFEFGSK